MLYFMMLLLMIILAQQIRFPLSSTQFASNGQNHLAHPINFRAVCVMEPVFFNSLPFSGHFILDT